GAPDPGHRSLPRRVPSRDLRDVRGRGGRRRYGMHRRPRCRSMEGARLPHERACLGRYLPGGRLRGRLHGTRRMKVHEIIAALERGAPAKHAYDWDKPGLSIGDPNADADHVLTALTVTRETFDRARETGAQLIVSHHPLIFQPLKSLRRDS